MQPKSIRTVQGVFESLQSDDSARGAPRLAHQTSQEEQSLREPKRLWLEDRAKTPESRAFMAKLWEVRCKFNQVLGLADSGVQGWQERFNFGNTEDENRGIVLDVWMDEVEKHKLAFRKVGRNLSVFEGSDPSQTQLQHQQWEKELTLCRIQAYWHMIHPKEVHYIVKVLGCRASRFMDALSVHVTPELLEEYVNLFKRVVNRRYQLQGRPLLMKSSEFDTVSDEAGDDDDVEEEVWEYLAAKSLVPSGDDFAGRVARLKQILDPTTMRVEIQFHWCGVPELLDTAKIKTIAALSACASDSGVFAPIACRALLEHQWEFTYMYFIFDRALDGLSILSLFMIVWTLKEDPHVQESPGSSNLRRAHLLASTKGYYVILVVVNSVLIFNIFCEAGTALVRYSSRSAPSFGPYISISTMGLVGMELVTGYLLYCMWGSMMAENTATDASAFENSVFIQRPVLFSMLILFKWLQFMSGCIVWEFFGLTVLPAFYAMTSTESMKFLLYVALILVMCTHAYWSIPLEAGDYELDGPWGSFVISFFRMFRLGVMGDFDVFELEGIDPMIDGGNTMDENPDDWSILRDHNFTAAHPLGMITGQGKAFYFHNGIRIITMLFGVGCTVIVMNMYIGVLSVSYEDNLASRIETFCHAKSKFITRYLLRRAVTRKVLRGITCGIYAPDDNEEIDSHIRETREHDPVFWQLFSRDEAYMETEDLDGEIVRAEDGEYDDCASPVAMPAAFTESCLPQKDSWRGFWCTVPANLLPARSDDQRFEKMEDNQQEMKTKLEELAMTVEQLRSKLKGGLRSRGRLAM